MIKIENFSKIYKPRSKNAFKILNLNFTVNNGSITGLVGPNGSGKSTVIKAICGFHYPTEGKIFISGNKSEAADITQTPEKAMELCGYVPEISMLPPDIKVIDFLFYAAKCHKLSPELTKERIKKVVDDFQLSDLLNNLIKNLSKGQQQRVSFAQALIHNPPNLVLDEPINGLDPSQIISFRDYVKELGKTKAILISTHILSEVNNLCQNAFIMHQGKLYEIKNLEKIEEEYIEITKNEKKENAL